MHKDHSKDLVQGSTMVLALDNKLVPVQHNKVVALALLEHNKAPALVVRSKVLASVPGSK